MCCVCRCAFCVCVCDIKKVVVCLFVICCVLLYDLALLCCFCVCVLLLFKTRVLLAIVCVLLYNVRFVCDVLCFFV